MMAIIKRILLFILFFVTLALSAQTSVQNKDAQTMKWQQKIDLDYTVPDYSVKKPDAKVMGWRLAKILQALEQNYTQGIYNHYLSLIFEHQADDKSILYMPIHKLKILNIQKQDSVITIHIRLFSKDKAFGKVEREVSLTFINSVSEDDSVNILFSELGQYIRKEN